MKLYINKIFKYITSFSLKSLFFKIKDYIVNFPQHWVITKGNIKELYYYTALLLLFLTNLCVTAFLTLPFVRNRSVNTLLKFTNTVSRWSAKFNKPSDKIIMNRLDIFDLAFKNMGAKKSRTFITIGGMALGVGTIVFLITLGYGVQKLVINRVARLEEIKQADVSTQPGSNIKIEDRHLEDFSNIPKVENTLPLIGLVAKINYQGSVSDVAVYGVTSDYLNNSAIRTINGKLFDSNKIFPESSAIDVNRGQVAGISDSSITHYYGEFIGQTTFTIYPRSWLEVREFPDSNSKILGYTKKSEGVQYADEVYGSYYPYNIRGKSAKDTNGNWLGKWLKTTVYIWGKGICESNNADCFEGNYIRMRDERGNLVQTTGYIAQVELMANKKSKEPLPEVLGLTNVLSESSVDEEVTTEGTTSEETAVDNLPSKEIATEQSDLDYLKSVLDVDNLLEDTGPKIKEVKLPNEAIKEAVVNEALLNVLGMDRNKAVGQEFNVSFVATSDLLGTEDENIQSIEEPYKIVGVIPGDETPFFYVPIIDLKVLGISTYSQVKVVAENKNDLQGIREKIEHMGFGTSSVADTISRINTLFTTIRFILGVIGAVALGVAALGMFNTLTVSLLERVHEIGLMKAMGMTSSEVKRLFLTESMMMGLLGGLFGITSGFLVGKSLSLVLSIAGLIKGVGIIDVIHLPPLFAILVFFLSIAVGILTGIYPSRKATRISALNALRYE